MNAATDHKPVWWILLVGIAPFAVALGLAALLEAAASPTFTDEPLIGAFVARMMIDALIAITLAVSLNVVNGLAGQFSLGHAGFLAIGGYASGLVTYYVSLVTWGSPLTHGMSGHLLFAASCIVGGCVAALAGWLVGLPSLRLRGDYLAIVTLGFGEIIRVLLTQTNRVIYSAEELRNAKLSDLIPPPVGGALGFADIPKYTNLFWATLFASITCIAALRLKRSSIGRAMIAVREDEIAAQSMGVDLTRAKVLAFVIAAFFAGIAGALYAHEPGTVLNPRDAGFQRSIEVVIMVVLGGWGSISGAAIAAVILSVLPEFLRDFDQYRLIVYALILIAMMLLRPRGLLGIKEIWQFLPGAKRKPHEQRRPA